MTPRRFQRRENGAALQKMPRNFTLAGKQYRVTYTLKTAFDGFTGKLRIIDSWLVIEAPEKIATVIHAIIEMRIGKTRLVH